MKTSTDPIVKAVFIAASLALAWHPVIWLVQTWTKPTYDSSGYIFLAAVLGLALRSILSGPPTGEAHRLLGGLLVLAATLRFLSQTLAVNLIGGFALAIDICALALLAGVDRRPRPVSPLWLSVLFLFSLPLEKVFERILGFPLQMVSAKVSCGFLSALVPGTECAGVRIGIAGQDVLVDLPCSGASGLMLLLALFAGLSAIQRPRLHIAVLAGVATLALAVLGNSVRISALALGLVNGWDVMAEPLHSIIGLLTLGLSALPLLLFYRATPRQPETRPKAIRMPVLPRFMRLPVALAFLGLSLWIITLPKSPIDVSIAMPPAPLPSMIAGEFGENVPLTEGEKVYFEAYGGKAVKAQYGVLGLNRVSTTSPLRHLHRPDVCLRGLGYTVRFLGTRHDDAPSSVYEATAPDGTAWLVTVSYVSDDGRVVSSVGEAIWHWFNGHGRTWSSVQRITPLSLDHKTRRQLDTAVLAALDISFLSMEPSL